MLTLSAGRQPDSREHFGFADGISDPVMDGTGREHEDCDCTPDPRHDSPSTTGMVPEELNPERGTPAPRERREEGPQITQKDADQRQKTWATKKHKGHKKKTRLECS